MLSSSATLARPVRMPARSLRKSSTAFSMRVLAWASASLLVAMVVIGWLLRFPGWLGRSDHRTDPCTQQHPFQISRHAHIEHDDGHFVVHAQRDGGGIHHRKTLLQNVEVGN